GNLCFESASVALRPRIPPESFDVDDEQVRPRTHLPQGIIMALVALVAISVLGVFLGGACEQVVHQMGVHAAIAGWIMGLMTSLPEMITFFAVYSTSKKGGTLHKLDDTQEALDNLTSSNMSNMGIIYPLGLLVFLLAG
ncbi:MAG: hypothetical protein HN348_31405, partial [Proteobacteria bacterium]|nr:hypothetical protein [Pseudomonadota bacterium]